MAWIHQELKRPGVTLLRLWLEYLEQQPADYRYSQFCRHYQRWARTLAPTMRQVHRVGEKVFVDFSSKKPSIIDAATGEITAVELFVGALGASSPLCQRDLVTPRPRRADEHLHARAPYLALMLRGISVTWG